MILSPSDPEFHDIAIPASRIYSDLEMKHLRILFDLVDVDSEIEGCGAWCDRQRITTIWERKTAIRGMLRNKQAELLATEAIRAPLKAVAPSAELLASKLVRK